MMKIMKRVGGEKKLGKINEISMKCWVGILEFFHKQNLVHIFQPNSPAAIPMKP